MARTIESPGIEINEIDLSLRASLPVGTNVFVQGFADSGPTDELINVTSVSELEQIYGLPTNAAERYFYHTAKQVLESPGNLLTNRLPYGLSGGGGYGADYTALVFPISTLNAGGSAVASVSDAEVYELLEPILIELTDAEYIGWQAGKLDALWSNNPNAAGSPIDAEDIGNAGLIIINQIKTSVDNNYAGYYVGLKDNTNLGDTVYDTFDGFEYDNNSVWSSVPVSMIETELSGTELNDSVSEDMETIADQFADFDSVEYDDSLMLGLFRLRESAQSQQAGVSLIAIPREKHVASLDATRTLQPDGQNESWFMENVVNEDSVYMKMYVHPALANQTSWRLPAGGTKKVRTTTLDKLYSIGTYIDVNDGSAKYIGSLPTKLARSLRLAENVEQIPMDIVLDGGLSTIHTVVAAAVANDNDCEAYNDTQFLYNVHEEENPGDITLTDQTDGASSPIQQDWSVIFNTLNTFCQSTRKDCLFIADALKHIFVQGDLTTLRDGAKNFSSDIYWPLKNLFGASNSNYACTYANWVKVYDNNLGAHTWLPFSGYEANIMCKMDAALQPWYAAAGLNNGIVRGISDIAINPTQKQRDLLYRISINPVVYFPGDGYTVWGQKTLQKKPSAFDRINVRRLFLVLEKATRAVMRYFVFEPNTVFTRTRVVNILNPIFEVAKNNEGVYDFLIVCDERNNTPNIIDNNELVVDIYLKPVRTAEYILINFYATRTDQDFTELI